MFAKPQLCQIFLSLLISSISFAMYSPEKKPFHYQNTGNFGHENQERKSKLNIESSYYPKGVFGDNRNMDTPLVKQLIEQAPPRVKRLINGLKNHKSDIENTSLKRLLLYGPPGNGKSLLSKAIAIEALGKYYFIRTPDLLTSWKNCHENLRAEIDFVTRDNKEPRVIIFDEVDQITNQYKDRNSSDKAMPTAFWSLLDYCEEYFPQLFFIGTTNNAKTDFPEQLISRFARNMVYISNPDFQTRKQLTCYYLNKKKHNLTENNIDEFAHRMDGRTCRDIRSIIDESVLFLPNDNDTITLNEIRLAEEENPYEPTLNKICKSNPPG